MLPDMTNTHFFSYFLMGCQHSILYRRLGLKIIASTSLYRASYVTWFQSTNMLNISYSPTCVHLALLSCHYPYPFIYLLTLKLSSNFRNNIARRSVLRHDGLKESTTLFTKNNYKWTETFHKSLLAYQNWQQW